MGGFLKEAATERHLQRGQEPREETLGLRAKHMGDRSEPGFWEPNVAATLMLNHRKAHRWLFRTLLCVTAWVFSGAFG